jgi:uncharacterized protein
VIRLVPDATWGTTVRRKVDTAETRRYDDAVTREESATTRRPRCPHCRREITWYGNPHRPFCSLACRLIDLGVWLDERYRIPGPEFSRDSTADGGRHDGG